MKYFTKELWRGDNSRQTTDLQGTFEQGERNRQEYSRQLESLRPRLSPEAYNFFTAETLHDGRLLAFSAGDGLDPEVRDPARFDINVHRPSVEMRVLGSNLDELYTLRYEKTRRILFDYPSDDPLFHREGGHIGDWGYDELTAVDDIYLRHEVLFASGTTIVIEFKDFSYGRERI